jgi:hypothetical protein
LLINRSGICLSRILPARWLTFSIAALLSLAVLPPCAHAQSSDFTIVALPDTQWYSESYPQTFTAQTQWIVNNSSALNVQMVLGMGDIVQTATNAWEYKNADTSVKLLDSANIPYLLPVGNHDYSNFQDLSGRTSEVTNFNTYFGPARYRNYSWYKGQYPTGSNENFYGVITIQGKTYLFLLLETFPRDSAVAWANSVLADYPSAEVIVITHAYVYTDNTLVSRCDQYNAPAYNVGADNDGDGLWSKFISQHSNISLVLSGHFTGSNGQGASRRIDLGVNGNIVNQILADYQDLPSGGQGYLRILKFSPSLNTISVSTYSPTLNRNLTDSNNQFAVQWHSTGPNPNGSGIVAGRVKDLSSCSAISGGTVSTTGHSSPTDSKGNFSLTLSAPATYAVTAQAGGYPSAVKNVNAATGYPTFTKYFLSNQPPGTISGTVTDSSGQALSGATVSYSDGSTTTDAGGNYSLAGVLVGSYTITAAANGYQTVSRQNVDVSPGVITTTNFVLTGFGTISGTVVSSAGVGIGGATVSYSGGSTTTAGNGAYSLSNVAAGTYSVTAAASGFQTSMQANVSVAANITTTLNFTLSTSGGQGYSISGTISPSSIGSGASVALSGPILMQSAHGSAATGNSSATVSFGAASAAGDMILVFTRTGEAGVSSVSDGQNTYASVLGPTQWGALPNFTDRWAQVFLAKNVTGGKVLTITVTLAGGSTHPIYLAALEYSGVDPVNPVNATAVGTGKVSQNGSPATGNLTTTVANAKLVATSWDSNESYGATGNGTGYTANAAAGAASLTGGPGWSNLTEDSTAATVGSWNATTSSAPEVDDWAIQLIALTPGPSRTIAADATGKYTFTSVNNGTYSVTASKSGVTFTPVSQSVTINGGSIAGINFTSISSGTITGSVTNSGGAALAGATVSYSGGSTTTASNGSYTLSNVQAGAFAVTASMTTGYQSSTQTVTVTAGATTTQNFTLLTGAGTLSGTVTSSGGTPLAGVTVSYSGGSATTGSNGSYTLLNVPVGTFPITASAIAYQSSIQSATITVNSTTTQNFALTAIPQTYSISGTISPAASGSGTAVALTGATPLLVQSARGSAASGFSSVTASFGTVSAAGDTILVFVRFGGTAVTKVTDNQPGATNTYTSVLGPTVWGVAPNPSDRYAQVFVAKNIPGGARLTITVTCADLSTRSLYVAAVEYSGVDPVNPINATATATGTASASGAPATGNLTTTIPNAKLVATSWDANDSYTATSNGTGYTTNSAASVASLTGGSGWGNLTEDNTAATPGSWMATTSTSQAVTDWAIQLVALAPVTSQNVTADASGNYTLTNVSNGIYTVVPAKPGAIFTPLNRSVTVNGANVAGVNFTVGSNGTISGTVVTLDGAAIAGASVSYTGGSTTTAANGTYTLSNVPAGTVSVTASATGYQSSTQSVTVAANTATTQSFTLSSAAAQTYSIQGTISPGSTSSGSSVALSGAVPVLVQSAHGSGGTGNSSATVSFGAAAGAGHTIVLFTRVGGTTISSVTDGTHTYSSVLGPTVWGAAPNWTDRWAQVFVAKNIAGGSVLTITVTLAGGSTHPVYLAALEYSGVDPVNPVNATAVGTGKVSQNGAPATGNLTTTVANTKLVATSWDSNESYGATGNGTGYTANAAAGAPSLTGGPGWSNLTEDSTAATAGSWKATTSSVPQVDDWAIQLIALTPANSQTVAADVNGNFTFTNVSNGTYTVTPTKAGLTFTPAAQSATVNAANLTGINFTATTSVTQTYSIQGTISPGSTSSGSSVALSGAVPVIVQSAHGSAGTGNSSATVSFGAAAGAGHTIVLFTRVGGTTISSVTDGTNTYSSALGPTVWGAAPNFTDRWAQVFVAKNIAGGSVLTITVTLAGGSTHPVYLAALEYSGVDPVNPVNATAVGTGKVSQNGAPATGNLTTTVANTKLVATSWDSNESYGATGNGTGYTANAAAGAASLTGGPGWSNLTEDSTAATAGSWKATTGSAPQVDDWAIQLIALTPANSQTVAADVNGNFTFTNVSNGTYTVTPTKAGLTFTPAAQSATVNAANLTGVNFTTP